MSLINDALKRAKQAQPNHLAPAAGPSLRPAEPARVSSSGTNFVLPGTILLVLALAGILFWQWFTVSATKTNKVDTSAKPSLNVASVVPAPVVTPATVAQSVIVEAKPLTKASEPVAKAEPVVSNTVTTVAEAPKPTPVTYRLQSIFYFAKNPSAMINGKTVFVGGKVGEARVIAISQESATIVMAGGRTNVLELR